MTQKEYVVRFLRPESCDPETARKSMINFITALAKADARRDAAETRRRDADVSL